MAFKELKDNSLVLFRKKNYVEALPLFEEIIKRVNDGDPELSDLRGDNLINEKRNLYNNMLVCIYHLMTRGLQKEGDKPRAYYYDRYDDYLNEYLKIAKATPPEKLKEWANNILVDLFEISFKLALTRHASDVDVGDTTKQKELLCGRIRDLYFRFVEIFCRMSVFAEMIFIGKYMDMLYFERGNVNRGGYSGQNYLNAQWLSELFLDIVKSDANTVKVRAAVMNLLSEIVLYSPQQKGGHRFSRERKALEWLDRSIGEDPGNIYAKEHKHQLTAFITSAEQINRFKHDAVSKIETMRGTIKKAMQLTGAGPAFESLLLAESTIDYILSSFRLTQREVAIVREIDVEEIFAYFYEDHFEKKITGTKSKIESDTGYIILILKNLVQNSKEAYGDRTPKTIGLIFDYDTQTFLVKDYAGGIPEEMQRGQKLFEPYASTKGIFQNSGLGLVNVKEACKLINATISFHTIIENSRKGTEFSIKLNQFEED